MIIETGSCLRDIRLGNKKTQKQMAQLFGVCRSTYSSWESKYKNKALPFKVCEKFHIVRCILSMEYRIPICKKYINAIIFDREEQKEFEKKFKNKKESILKRILKWIMRKN